MHINLRVAVAVGISFTLCLVTALCGQPAAAADPYPSFRILQIASSQDGNAQIIELEEMGGNDGQQRFAGLALEVTNRFGTTKTFVFPSDLPNADTANKHVTIATGTGGIFEHKAFVPDFHLQPQFLPTDGGTIRFTVCIACTDSYAIDVWSFAAIPTGGGLLQRSGEARPGTVQSFPGGTIACCGPVFGVPAAIGIDITLSAVVEYYNAALDQYFISASQPDVEALDTGRIEGWQRVGWFLVLSAPIGSSSYARPVCRFYIPPASHFLSASAGECDVAARQYSEFILETPAAFYAALPDSATGGCPRDLGTPGLLAVFNPVYRLWNGRPDTNHRYTTSLDVRAEMIGKGWVSEGYGPMGVAMCVVDWF